MGCFVASLLAMTSAASELTTTLAYRAQQARENSLDPSVQLAGALRPWLDGRAGVRFTTSSAGVEAFDYFGELRVPIVTGVAIAGRLFQGNQLIAGAGNTQFLIRAEGKLFVWSWLWLEGAFGWQERFTALGSVPILPGLARTSFTEHDFAFAAGGGFAPHPAWAVSARVATFEDFDAYNLNSPYFQATVEHRPPGAAAAFFAFGRYRALLGFGRRDELQIGVGLRFELPGAGGRFEPPEMSFRLSPPSASGS